MYVYIHVYDMYRLTPYIYAYVYITYTYVYECICMYMYLHMYTYVHVFFLGVTILQASRCRRPSRPPRSSVQPGPKYATGIMLRRIPQHIYIIYIYTDRDANMDRYRYTYRYGYGHGYECTYY